MCANQRKTKNDSFSKKIWTHNKQKERCMEKKQYHEGSELLQRIVRTYRCKKDL